MRDVCVVIADDAGGPRLGRALASILANTGGLCVDAVVVDDGDGRTATYVGEEFLGVRTVRCAGQGLGHAYNRALETVVDARYVLFLAAHLEVCDGSVSALVSVLDREPDIALAGVRQLSASGALLPTMRRFPSPLHGLAEALGVDRLPGVRLLLGEREVGSRKYGRLTICEWTSEFMLVRRSALEHVGWFDQRFRHFAAEADLCLRLRRSGWKVAHIPELTVRFQEGGTGRLNPSEEAQVALSRMQFARKHFPASSADYRLALALRYALRLGAYAVLPSRRRGGFNAARAALGAVARGCPPAEGRSIP